MSEDNSIQPQEDKLISQAKKRLLGASIILFILLISAPFVLKNRNEEGPTEPIKILMESSLEIVDVNVEIPLGKIKARPLGTTQKRKLRWQTPAHN